MKLLIALVLTTALGAPAAAQFMPTGADLAAVAHPPKGKPKAKAADEKAKAQPETMPPSMTASTGFDYFDMVAVTVRPPAKKKQARPEPIVWRDAVASPRPVKKNATQN